MNANLLNNQLNKYQITATPEWIWAASSMALQDSTKVDCCHEIAIPVAREGMVCIDLVGAPFQTMNFLGI